MSSASSAPNSANSPVLHVIIATFTDRCAIDVAGAVVHCPLPDPHRVGRVAVGDRVELDPRSPRVVSIAERRTILSRPDPRLRGRELVIAANVDLVVVVASVVAPPLKPRLVDRYWVAAERGGATPLLAVNKIDLAGDAPGREEATRDLASHAEAGLSILHTSTATGEGIDALRAAIGPRTAVFVGHSGVGKSSLVNAVLGGHYVKAGLISDAHRKGKHTTTASSVHAMAAGGSIIDTPGVRSFGLWAVDARSLAAYFPDFTPFARCKFRDCGHAGEPRCEVAAAVTRGDVSPARYAAYRRLLEGLGSE